ncbi:hypothetical protein D9M71_522530 [compost metagenome]
MNAIGLHQLGHTAHPLKEKWHQRHLFLARQVFIDPGESRGVAHAIVGRQAHAQQQDFGPRLSGSVNHRGKILLQLRRKLPTQAIIATQLQHHQLRFVLCKQRRQPRLATCTGVTADRGIDHFTVETLGLQPLLQQGNPALAGIQAESGTDTIADNQDGTRCCALGHAHQGQASTHKPHSHRILHGPQHSHCAEP